MKLAMSSELKYIDDIAKRLYVACPSIGDEVRYFIACQFALESAYGTSRIAKSRMNHCGMNVPLLRPSLNTAVSGFASYNSLDDCVRDYVLWLAWNKFGYYDLHDLDLFKKKLKAKGYCPAKDYINRIETVYLQYANL